MDRLFRVLSLSWMDRFLEPSSVDRRGEPPETDQDLIGSASSKKEVISALSQRGCSDLTTEIDLEACSDLPLAGGGFCDVYQGSLNNGTKIAIKSLRLYDQPGRDSEKGKILKRAARELYHWSKLKYPNVLPLMGLAMFRGHLSMVSQWMENGNLMSYLSLNPDVDRLALCIHVCAGLSYIHDNDMVHGDLKAANIMVSQNREVMIADFGNSQLRDLTLKFTNTTSSSVSVRWAAPELLLSEGSGSHVSKKSDVYAYGMTVLETLTGEVPFEEFSERKVLFLVALKRQIPARPAHGVSGDIWDTLKRCWKWEQSARPDIRAIEKMLRDIYFHAWVEARSQSDLSTGSLEMNESAMPEVALQGTNGSDGPRGAYRKGLRGLSDLATKYQIQERLGESELLLAETLGVQKRVLGADHPDTLLSMYNLAITYDKQGRLSEAELLHAETLPARKRVLGADHPDTLQSMHNLAVTYGHQGRLAEAEPLYAGLLAARKRVLGANHPDTLHSMHNLAWVYHNQGRLAEAELLLAEVLAARKRMLGADHHDTLLSLYNLAWAYHLQGRLAEAESLRLEVLDARKRVLGPEHPNTLRSMHNLAFTYDEQGRLAEAEPLYAKVLAARKRVLGPYHPDTLHSIRKLATTHCELRRRAEAEPLYPEVLVTRKRVLGADHFDTRQSIEALVPSHRMSL